MAKLDPTIDQEILLPCADTEMQQPKFYEENKYWLMAEVEKYMKGNQERIC